LMAERDENTCRKDFTPSEAVAIAKTLEQLEKPKAAQRQEASRAKQGEKVGTAQGGGNLPPRSEDRGKTRDKIAAAVGTSASNLRKIKEVVEAAEAEPEKFGPVKEEMDRTGKVDPAFRKVREHQQKGEASAAAGSPLTEQEWGQVLNAAVAKLRDLAHEGFNLLKLRPAERDPELLRKFAQSIQRVAKAVEP